MASHVRMQLLEGDYGVARLEPSEPIPAWAEGQGFVSTSRSDEELSIVCLDSRIPEGVRDDRGWACLKLLGPFAFDETGIVLSVIAPLSSNGIGIFVVSTFDGDHVMVKREDMDVARQLLTEAGHTLV